MNANFIAHGLLFLVGATFAFRAVAGGSARYAFLFFVALNALGSTIVAIVHNAPSVYSHGIAALHGLGALVAIVGGNFAIVVAGACAGRAGASPRYRVASIAIGVVGIACFLILGHAAGTLADSGAWERGSVYTIMLWEIMTATAMLRR